MSAGRYVKGVWEVSWVEVRRERRSMSCDARGVVVGENADENVRSLGDLGGLDL